MYVVFASDCSLSFSQIPLFSFGNFVPIPTIYSSTLTIGAICLLTQLPSVSVSLSMPGSHFGVLLVCVAASPFSAASHYIISLLLRLQRRLISRRILIFGVFYGRYLPRSEGYFFVALFLIVYFQDPIFLAWDGSPNPSNSSWLPSTNTVLVDPHQPPKWLISIELVDRYLGQLASNYHFRASWSQDLFSISQVPLAASSHIVYGD